MDFQALLQDLLYTVITVCVPIVVKYLQDFIKSKIEQIAQNTENKKISDLLYQAEDLIVNVVTSVNQTYVDVLKENGKFDEEAANKAKGMALDAIKEMLTEKMKWAIEETYKDVNAYLETAIESSVRTAKK